MTVEVGDALAERTHHDEQRDQGGRESQRDSSARQARCAISAGPMVRRRFSFHDSVATSQPLPGPASCA